MTYRTTIPATMLRPGDIAHMGTGPAGRVLDVSRPFGSTMVTVLLDSGTRFHLNASTILPITREESARSLNPATHCFREDNCVDHLDHDSEGCCCCGRSADEHTGCDCEESAR